MFDQLEGPSEDERKLRTAQRDKLETERLKLVQAHYADARTGLDQLTDLLVDLDDFYNKCEPTERRILNRALFTRITIDAPAQLTAETKLPRHQAGQFRLSNLTWS